MIHRIQLPVVYGDLRPDGALRLDALADYLQAAAIDHAAAAGHGLPELARAGATWVLYRLSALMLAQPRRGDQLVIDTWSVGFRGVRAGREFEIRCGDRLIARAGSTWIFYDTERAMPRRIPLEMEHAFKPEPAGEGFAGTAHDLQLAAVPAAESPASACVSLRASDYDDNGHVNNAVYLDFALTALARQQPGRPAPVGFVVAFMREIRADATAVDVTMADGAGGAAFSVFAGGIERARGVLRF